MSACCIAGPLRLVEVFDSVALAQRLDPVYFHAKLVERDGQTPGRFLLSDAAKEDEIGDLASARRPPPSMMHNELKAIRSHVIHQTVQTLAHRSRPTAEGPGKLAH